MIPLRADDEPDMHFDIDGGPFHWLRLNSSHVTGLVDWAGQEVVLSGVTAEFYGGVAIGSGEVSLVLTNGTDYQFDLAVTNAQLKALMTDVSRQTNKLEGTLSGVLVVTDANTANIRTWEGHGAVVLKDGLIWDIPVFGVVSTILNGLSPGLGNNRASAATGSFAITNGVVYTKDLEIRTPSMRLAYRGTVGLDGQVNARADAELLRDMWLVGPVVSKVFWPVTKVFESKITGSLKEPKTEPVYLIPKIMLAPFHPLKSLKDLFQIPQAGPRTNAPPAARIQ
jgi:hypothetical protein